MSRKPKLNVRIEASLLAKVDGAASSPSVSKASVVERALTEHFDPAHEAHRFDTMFRLLDRQHRELKRIERTNNVAIEMLAVFVRHYLATNPPLAEDQQAAARASGRERFDGYLGLVKDKLRADGTVRAILADVLPKGDPDTGAQR